MKDAIKKEVSEGQELIAGMQHIIDRFASEASAKEYLEDSVALLKRENEELRQKVTKLETKVANTHAEYRFNKNPKWFTINVSNALEGTQDALEIIQDFIEDDSNPEEVVEMTMERTSDVICDFTREVDKLNNQINPFK